MEAGLSSVHAILWKNVKMRIYQSTETVAENNDEKERDEISFKAGQLIKIFQFNAPKQEQSYFGGGSINLSIVQVLDLVNHVPIFENLYECPQECLRLVNKFLWPYVISIVDPEQRLIMLGDENHCQWVLRLQINDIITVSGEMFDKPSVNYDCIIRYIGPVLELHAVGYFFGLEILDINNGISPQANKISLSITYMECNPELAIFSTANWIKPVIREQQKKFSPRDLITGTIEKVKSAIGPNSALTGSSGANTYYSKKDKNIKKNKQAAPSQFYYDIKDTTDSCNMSNNPLEQNKKEFPMLSDEFKQSIENREKSLERRGITNTVQTQTQSGILKNKHKEQTKPSQATKSNVDGREILYSDNFDIDDSTRNKRIIVVEKEPKNDVDLVQVLGNGWPNAAGDAALILNKSKSNVTVVQQYYDSVSNNIHSIENNRSKYSNPHLHLCKNTTKKLNSLSNTIDNKKMQKTHNKYLCDNHEFIENEPLLDNTTSNHIDIDSAYDPPELLPAVLDNEFLTVSSIKDVQGTDLGVDSLVEVNVPESSELLYGVIRWIGETPDKKNRLVGVELEDDYIDKQLSTTDGFYNGILLFKCTAGRGLFVDSNQCSIDTRFLGADCGAAGNGIRESNDNKMKTFNGFNENQPTFGHMECPVVPGSVAPIKCFSLNDLEKLCGKFKGIQGHHNSCYLDVTLFAMFAFTPVFDAILYRPSEKDDISQYTEVQTVLREEIVNPLRKHTFVRADRVMKLRQLLDKLSSVSGLTSEEKDPEEFLNCLLSQIMRAEPFLKLSSGQDAYYYQLFVDKDERLLFPSVQQLFEQSFYTSDIKLKEVPSCLIIQMPRFGKNFKVYPRILPSQVLDVTDIIDDSPRQCSVCGKLAEFECRDCFGVLQNGIGLESTSFCLTCLQTVHMHSKRSNHTHRKLYVPQDFKIMAEQMTVPRLYMELFAVVCIETSHYVAFVKAGSGPDAPWCFFDSMADRKGEKNGYNIPEMLTVPDLPQWLSEEGARAVNETSSNDKMLPEHAKRLFCDAYMCMYQSTDVMMYR